MPVSEPSSDNLRARAFTVAHHITGEKRPVVFLHVAEAEVERLREAGERLRRTLDINLGCGHINARAESHDDCPYCRAKRTALDEWDDALRNKTR